MYEVIYFSRGGNTRKLALAIAEELGVKPRFIRMVDELPESAHIFLGSGLYFMRPARLIRDFIRNNDFQGRKVAVFGTSTSGVGVETIRMERALRRKGATITGKFYCPGKFSLRFPRRGSNATRRLYLRKSKPTEEDLERARRFARSVVQTDAGVEQTKTRQVHGAHVFPGGGRMKIEYIHGSRYGNGVMIADEFKRQMAAKGTMVNVRHVRDVRPREIPPADLYVFSSPGRFGKPVREMRKLLKAAALSPGTRYALMVTELAPKPAVQERMPAEDKAGTCQRVIPIMNELLQEKGLVTVAEGKIFVTGLKGPLEKDWQKHVEALVSRIPVPQPDTVGDERSADARVMSVV